MSEFSGLSQWDDSMRLALDQARLASMHGDVPVGAVVIDQAGGLLAAAATSGRSGTIRRRMPSSSPCARRQGGCDRGG